jgi:hypothetical protein
MDDFRVPGMLFTPFQNALLRIPADRNVPPPSAVALLLANSEHVTLFCKILFDSPCQCVYRRGKKFGSRFTDFCEVSPSAFVKKKSLFFECRLLKILQKV